MRRGEAGVTVRFLCWPDRAAARWMRCLRCGALLGTRRPVTADRWPGAGFCSEACLTRHDEGFEAARRAFNERRRG